MVERFVVAAAIAGDRCLNQSLLLPEPFIRQTFNTRPSFSIAYILNACLILPP